MADQLPTLSPEDQELQQLIEKINGTPKRSRWIQLFLDKSNKETFGNRTQSAIQAYNLDPVTQYNSAMHIGWENYRKVQMLASEYFERAGWTVTKQLDLLVLKATESKSAKFLQIWLEITGIYNPKPTTLINQNTNNGTINNVQISAEARQKKHKEFEEFINAKYKSPFASQPVVQQDTPLPSNLSSTEVTQVS